MEWNGMERNGTEGIRLLVLDKGGCNCLFCGCGYMETDGWIQIVRSDWIR
jgi:hypothetical protein